MSGLKSYLPSLSALLDTSPTALYERQRVLTRLMESVDVVKGRGPGSGVRATSRTVTLLIIAVLSTESLAETYERTIVIGAAKAVDGKCPFTGTPFFSHALAAILADQALANLVIEVTVRRPQGIASIKYRSGRKTLVSEFRASDARHALVYRDASLAGGALGVIQMELALMQTDSVEGT
jgi:hypothetical protein